MFIHAFHANPGSERKQAGPVSYISRHKFGKFSNMSTNKKVSVWTYETCTHLNCLFYHLYQLILGVYNLQQWYLPCLGSFSGNEVSLNISQSSIYS